MTMNLKTILYQLASDEFQGRKTGEDGQKIFQLVYGSKFTHLLRCFKLLQSSCTKVHSGLRVSCALHMDNFVSFAPLRATQTRVFGQALINL